jgi:hypothetical protein
MHKRFTPLLYARTERACQLDGARRHGPIVALRAACPYAGFSVEEVFVQEQIIVVSAPDNESSKKLPRKRVSTYRRPSAGLSHLIETLQGMREKGAEGHSPGASGEAQEDPGEEEPHGQP